MTIKAEDVRKRIAEIREQRIHDEYKLIMAKIEGVNLYGTPIDFSNTEQLVVAAFCSGQYSAIAIQAHALRELEELKLP